MTRKRNDFSDEKVAKIINNCVANASLEGLICDEDDVAAMQRIVSGETTLDTELDAVIEQYYAPSGSTG